MGISKYLPTWVISVLDRISGARGQINSLTGENRRLKEELTIRKEVVLTAGRAEELIEELRRANGENLATILRGPESKSGELSEEERARLEVLDMEGSIINERDTYHFLYTRAGQERDTLREALFERDIGGLIKAGGFKNPALMVYNPGDVLYTTPAFDKKIPGVRNGLGQKLGNHEGLDEALANGEVTQIEHEGVAIKFVPCKGRKSRTLAVAYVVDPGHRKGMLQDIRAIRAIRNYLNDVDLGLMGIREKEERASQD
jgi:hypothetical protein